MKPDKKSLGIVLTADIGGTNSTFAVIDAAAKPARIVHKKRYSTQDITSFTGTVNRYLHELKQATKIAPRTGCIAIAGPVADNRGKITHATFWIDAREILDNTPLEQCLVINDFDAVSFSIATLHPNDMKVVKPGTAHERHPMVVIGAGTGLGKSLLVWEEHYKAYVPVPSETGHADLILHTKEEFEFAQFTLQRLNVKAPASWEMVLSGQGLVNVYQYLKSASFPSHKESKDIKEHGPSPGLIALHRKTDALCTETFAWFERFYARLAKNAVLDHVAKGGVYIAGGIVAKNPDMFTPVFTHEFMDNLRLREILESAPVWAITNYDVSLFGCANALNVWKERILTKT